MKFILKYLFVFCILPVLAPAQVYLSGLSSNPEITNYLKKTDNFSLSTFNPGKSSRIIAREIAWVIWRLFEHSSGTEL